MARSKNYLTQRTEIELPRYTFVGTNALINSWKFYIDILKL